jgi:hypothetical protein
MPKINYGKQTTQTLQAFVDELRVVAAGIEGEIAAMSAQGIEEMRVGNDGDRQLALTKAWNYEAAVKTALRLARNENGAFGVPLEDAEPQTAGSATASSVSAKKSRRPKK